jgi:hypothetical protein
MTTDFSEIWISDSHWPLSQSVKRPGFEKSPLIIMSQSYRESLSSLRWERVALRNRIGVLLVWEGRV